MIAVCVRGDCEGVEKLVLGRDCSGLIYHGNVSISCHLGFDNVTSNGINALVYHIKIRFPFFTVISPYPDSWHYRPVEPIQHSGTLTGKRATLLFQKSQT